MSNGLLIEALADPGSTGGWAGNAWSRVFQQARATGLLGRLAERLKDMPTDAGGSCPPGMAGHLDAALRVCRAQQAEVRREARYIDHALSGLGAPVVLLKGAAYGVADLPAARGRVFSDVDIMVPKTHLPQAESLLAMHGWMTTEQSAYNQRYYRQWMHELPPMQHLQRGTVLDVHHTILPDTARLRPDPQKLFASALHLPGTQVLHVLAPVDMLLHSMTHLFMNDDMTHALRDLSDLDLLLRHFAHPSDVLEGLAQRGAELDLTRPLYYALRHAQRIWQTPVPEAVRLTVEKQAPPRALGALMDAIWSHVFDGSLLGVEPLARGAALGALYLRGHWVRMPPLLLAKHLTIKALGLHEDKPRKVSSLAP